MSWDALFLAFLAGAIIMAIILVYVVKAYQEPPPECGGGHVFEDHEVHSLQRDNPLELELRYYYGNSYYLYAKARTTCRREDCGATDEKWIRVDSWDNPHNVPKTLRPDK